jgi:cysteine desulfurase / selenocysteine lyase
MPSGLNMTLPEAERAKGPFDVARARRETAGCATHIHLNNAGASLMPDPVLDTVIGHLRMESGIGGYEAASAAAGRLDGVYGSVARLLNCAADEVALIENATRAWDMAFYSLTFRPGDRILTSVAEYASNYIAFLQMARRSGVVVDIIPNDAAGRISIEALEGMMDRRKTLVAVTHVPTNGGLVNPVVEVGRVARAHGALFLLDACQSVGQMPIDVETIGCDILSATGRKYLRGPRGTGFLYMRRSLLERVEPVFLDLHAATLTGPNDYRLEPTAKRFENWESYVAGRLGLGAAIDYALDWGIEAIKARIDLLSAHLRRRLADLKGVRLRDLGPDPCGIVSFTLDRAEPDEVALALRQQAVNVSVSRATSTLLDMRARGIERLIRASVHYFNTEEELESFAERLALLLD